MSSLNYASFFEVIMSGVKEKYEEDMALVLLGCIYQTVPVYKRKIKKDEKPQLYSDTGIDRGTLSLYKNQKAGIPQKLVEAAGDARVEKKAPQYFLEEVVDRLDNDLRWDMLESLHKLIENADNIRPATRTRFNRLAERLDTPEKIANYLAQVFLYAIKMDNTKSEGTVIPEEHKKNNLSNSSQPFIPEEQGYSNEAVSYELTDIPPAVDLTGREDDIHAVKELLRNNFIVCIHANGGVGKTALALRVINDIKADVLSEKKRYKHIAWITCTGNLKDDLGKLEIPALKVAQTAGKKYKEACGYLKNNNVFLVLDNMDIIPNTKELTQLNTLSGKTTILITTRSEIPFFARYELNNLNQDKALQLFYTHYLRKRGTNNLTNKVVQGMDDYEYAQKIVQASSYNTLFIELIGKMAYLDHWKLDKLQKKLEEGGIFSQDSKSIIPTTHGTDKKLLAQIRELYLMSRLTNRQKEIMRFLALFPAEHSIFFDVFEWAGFFDDEEENFGELQDRGWIERDSEGYYIHTMVRGSIELQDEFGKTDITMYDKLIKELSDTEQYMPITMKYTKVRERMVVPETVCKLLLQSDDNNYSTLFNSFAVVCRIQGCFKEASDYFRKVLDLREHKLGKDHPDTALVYNNLSLTYRSEGKYEDAFKYCMMALTIQERVFGKKHLTTAAQYNNLAALYSEQGNYEEALKYYKKALEIRECKLGKEHPDTAMIYNNIAGVYYKQGNYEKTKEILRTVLPIQKKVLGKEHPNTVMTYNNLTVLFQAQGEYEEALRYCKESLDIQREAFGEKHPATARVYNNLAGILCAEGNYEEALKYYKKALFIRNRAFGEDNPVTAETYSNMAEVYYAKAKYKDALKYIFKAMSIYNKVFGEEHPDTAITYYRLAMIYQNQGRDKEAQNYFKKSLDIRRLIYGESNVFTADSYYMLGLSYDRIKEYKKAMENTEKSYQIYLELFGNEDNRTINAKNNVEKYGIILKQEKYQLL